MEKRSKYLILLSKIFFIWLLIQFFLNTFVTFELWLSWPVWTGIWLWKELLIVGLTICVIRLIIRNKNQEYSLIKKLPIWWYIFLFLATLGITFFISLFMTHVGIGQYIISIRYSMIGFFIFILFFILARLYIDAKNLSLINRYNKLLKRVLWGALCRRALVWLMPNALKFFGYNQFGIEAGIGEAPPAAYHTNYNQWYVRNQFLFERPIWFGFFLIVFWPIFFLLSLNGKNKKTLLWYGALYWLMVLSTFSRAALGVWLLQTAILLFLTYRKYLLKLVVIIPWLIVLVLLWIFVYKKISVRIYSDVGHVKLLQEWLTIIQNNPLFGRGAWYAGPASHQICFKNPDNNICQQIHKINTNYEITTSGFNPENQYVQILIEYGIVGFIWRCILYFYLHIIGLKHYKALSESYHDKRNKLHKTLLFACALWLLGLSIEWFVLHSFVDRMIVYPFMALFGIIYALYKKHENAQAR